jgi:hypothetical protein
MGGTPAGARAGVKANDASSGRSQGRGSAGELAKAVGATGVALLIADCSTTRGRNGGSSSTGPPPRWASQSAMCKDIVGSHLRPHPVLAGCPNSRQPRRSPSARRTRRSGKRRHPILCQPARSGDRTRRHLPTPAHEIAGEQRI